MHLKIPAKNGRILDLNPLFGPENEAIRIRVLSWRGRIGIIWVSAEPQDGEHCGRQFGVYRSEQVAIRAKGRDVTSVEGGYQLKETETAYRGLSEDQRAD